MNELKRQAYLQAMEVDNYHPRMQLPGARPSALCEMPVPILPGPDISAAQHQPLNDTVAIIDAKLESAETQARSSTTTSSKSNSVIHALFDSFQEDSNKNISKKSPAANTDTADIKSGKNAGLKQPITEKTPHFSLSIVRGSNVIVIDDGLVKPNDKNDYLRLVQNILFAIGASVHQLSVDQFHWPVVKNNQIDQSKTAAQQALESFLKKQVQQQDITYLIVMGETAITFLTEESLSERTDIEGRFISHQKLEAEIIYTASAMQSMESSSIKRQIWQDIQPILRVLRKN